MDFKLSLGLFLTVLGLFTAEVRAQASSEQAKTCDDSKRIYKICSDQNQGYLHALKQATDEGKLVVITFGADWCPWCKSLKKMFLSSDFQDAVGKDFLPLDVGVYRYDSYDKVESGMSILRSLLQINSVDSKIVEGFPFLAVVEPQTQRAIFINTGGLEDNTNGQGHDLQKVLSALKGAADQLSAN